ncbi:MAG: hypothetical protein NZL98_05550, partial [Anaerolineales bacterium]|nr:hypothetical protein [Anaerolineales bacterium]
ETHLTCPQDCLSTSVSGRTVVTYLETEGVGRIAVQIAYPPAPRYPDGLGVVVIVSPFLTEIDGFVNDPDLTSIGLIQVSYLWPGKADSRSGMRSEGQFDYGGDVSLQALRDVIRFAAGRKTDVSGRSISALLPVRVAPDEVGLYAFSHAGLAAINVIAVYGESLSGLQYLVANEVPTTDTLACLEIGHYEAGLPVRNPLYTYPFSYTPTRINMDYSSVRWDAAYRHANPDYQGRPYFDLDQNGIVSAGDYVLGPEVPWMFGKRYYSIALTKALWKNNIFSAETWPTDVATPQEAEQAWQFRQPVERFDEIDRLQKANFKVMLVFADQDHAQPAADKPHIHQAFQGFRFIAQPKTTNLRWVRLNPDRSYAGLFVSDILKYPDNPANTAPPDWTDLSGWVYPYQSRLLMALAAVAEMADRAHTGRWEPNLGNALYPNPVPATPPLTP